MNLGDSRLVAHVKAHYDKVLALGALLALVVSLLLLGLRLHALSKADAAFARWLNGLKAVNPEASLVDAEAFNLAKASLASPFLLAQPGTNGAPWMFVPETRFNCRGCRLPVAIEAKVCPFCKTDVLPPEKIVHDHDGDGLPSDWERRYGLDPFDATDVQKDLDGDGYTNMQELEAGTDPSDPESRPDAIERLMFEQITGVPFAIQFKSRMKTPTGGYKFGLNYEQGGQTKTTFIELGQMVAGYKVENYAEKWEKATPPGMGRVDRSELTLTNSTDGAIILVKDLPVSHVKYTVHLSINLKGQDIRYTLQKNEQFDVDGKAYTVIGIDDKAQHVIIRSALTGEQRTIRKVSVVEPVVEPVAEPVAEPVTKGFE